ncbi:FIST N-terminal domain-containing protein [Sulfurospirillum arcachonense]|uniref:FIST N-terminal domain-containing protein n=1 Tax=Sulfurospirillum arcachonense TaxID=57666 RepID=UPI00046A7F2B|nr:FIST N-terminal domain-containing protein [Sulfurospirillum arcachonense]
MKTINAYYTSPESLSSFLEEESISDSSKLLIQVFSGKNDFDFIKDLTTFFLENFPLASLVGATTDGEIKDGQVSIDTTVISFTTFENTSLKTYISNEFENYFQAGQDLATNIIEEDSKVIISFIDGLLGNGEEYLNGISSINNEIIVAGGLAGDNATFTKTYVFTKDTIYTNGVVGVSLSNSDLKVMTDYSFNWLPIGQKLKITKADKNRVYTIDNKTAVETYGYYLGDDISEQLPNIGIEFPLILEKNGIQIARAVIGKNDDGSLLFAGNLQDMDEVRFGYGNANEILGKTQSHIDKLYNQPVESIFIYSCMARRRFMPEQIENETIIYNQIAPTSGFYTNGEFFSTKGYKELLNQSTTILVLSELDVCNTKEITFKTLKNVSTTIQALSHLVHVSTEELQRKDEIMVAQSRNVAMGEMLNMIAHQWRQPLSVISMSADNILLDKELDCLEDESFTENLNSIKNESSSLSQIINNFKNYFSSTKEKEEILIKTLVEDTKDIINLNLKSNDIKLITDHQCDLSIATHKQQLMQVLLNLINNAKEALIANQKEKKIIVLSTKEDTNNILIEVCDNAGGIKEAILNDIFNPYFTTKNELDGAGLGLYMSKIVIEKHMKGKLSVYNMKEGACFSIVIPR